LYSTYCISRLAYRLQFNGFDNTLKKLEARMLAKVTSTPMHVVNATVTGFLSMVYKKGLFPDLRLLSEATLLRVWCKFDSAQALYDRFNSMQEDDDLLFIAPFPEWHGSAVIKTLGDIHRKHSGLLDTLTLRHRGLQGAIREALTHFTHSNDNFRELVQQRLRQFELTPEALHNIMMNLKAAMGLLPLPAVTSYVKAVLNGWTTSHRMGLSVGPCPFCGLSGGDSMLHGLGCALFSGTVHRLMPALALPEPRTAFVRMLGGSSLPSVAAAGLAIAVDCIHSAMMGARFGGSPGTGFELAEARLRARCIACSRTRSIVQTFRSADISLGGS
jgi:hypothetical protein